MKKIPVIYWSGTGNTEKMAEAVAEGIKSAGNEPILLPVAAADVNEIASYDNIALGCPSMGAEVLEETVFDPFFSSLCNSLHNKNIVLFGSYGWGGSYMTDWESRISESGGTLLSPGLLSLGEPDADSLASCKALGETLAKA